MDIMIPSNFKELMAGICFLLSVVFVLISLKQSIRSHSVRILGILIIAALSIFCGNSWCYFAAIFIIGTAVTELEFLQKLAAIIRGRKDYFDYEMKKLEFMSRKEVEANIEREVKEMNELDVNVTSDKEDIKKDLTDQLDKKEPKGKELQDIPSTICVKRSVKDVVQFAFMVEDYVIRYLEEKYCNVIKRNIRLKSNESMHEFDGVLELSSRVLLIEVKTSRKNSIPFNAIQKSFYRLYESSLQVKTLYNKDIELKFILVGNFNNIFKDKIKTFEEQKRRDLNTIIDFEIYTFDDLGISENDLV